MEKGKVYVGTSPSGEKIEISTSTKKHIPIYDVTVTFYTALHPTVPNTIKISKPFTQWFDAAGHFVPLPFQQMLAGGVAIIGAADPTKVISSGGKIVQATPTGQELQDLLNTIPASSVSGVKKEGPDSTGFARKGKGKKKA